jgi:phage shock protein A
MQAQSRWEPLMSFFDRIANLWNGFWSIWISDKEKQNPEAVYQSAIDQRIVKHRDLKKAVGGIVYLRNKIQNELETAERELKEVNEQLPVALEQNEDEVALVLLQRQGELQKIVDSKKIELEKVVKQAEDAKAALVQFQGEIEKLKRERDQMMAEKATAEARMKVQETLNGLSMDADVKALDGVREHIQQLKAQADVGSEVEGESMDSKLKKIKEKTADVASRGKLEELKRQMAAQKAAAAGDAVKKTM